MTGTLPRTVDAIRGLRAARWIRESTAEQRERYGPDAQRRIQDADIRRLGLADTGLAWEPAHSGATVYRSDAETVALARPEGREHRPATVTIPIEGRRDWRAVVRSA